VAEAMVVEDSGVPVVMFSDSFSTCILTIDASLTGLTPTFPQSSAAP
jgi:hypothetical protein